MILASRICRRRLLVHAHMAAKLPPISNGVPTSIGVFWKTSRIDVRGCFRRGQKLCPMVLRLCEISYDFARLRGIFVRFCKAQKIGRPAPNSFWPKAANLSHQWFLYGAHVHKSSPPEPSLSDSPAEVKLSLDASTHLAVVVKSSYRWP